ncbi:MAG: hypothetical protein CSA21_01325 [Deltaproteobacteria bacterium]|nr:MAG: hypothetical protein CSA21_01325 [Deltaproteobacteria bacterium]
MNSGNTLQLLNPQGTPANETVPTALNDILPPVTLPDPVPWLLYALIALGSFAVVLCVILWLRRQKNNTIPPIAPGTIAKERLRKARDLMHEETAIPYLSRIADILREYIEAQFQLRPTRQTTKEFFTTLAEQRSTELLRFQKELHLFLESCDRAKFAHHQAEMAEMETMEINLITFIEKTSVTTEHDDL